MTDKTQLLPVTQADRDAAADYIGPLAGALTDKKLRSGKSDHVALVQAFTRHRISHSLPGDVGMRETLSKRTLVLCVSGKGPTPHLEIHFANLADAHAAHNELLGIKGETRDAL